MKGETQKWKSVNTIIMAIIADQDLKCKVPQISLRSIQESTLKYRRVAVSRRKFLIEAYKLLSSIPIKRNQGLRSS